MARETWSLFGPIQAENLIQRSAQQRLAYLPGRFAENANGEADLEHDQDGTHHGKRDRVFFHQYSRSLGGT